MPRILQVTAMLLVLPFALVGCKKSDEAVFLQYFNLAVREMDREIEMLKKRDSEHTERMIQKLMGDIRHLESKMIVFHNKPHLHKELHERGAQLYEIRKALIDKDIDREIAMLKEREPGLEESVIKQLRVEIRRMYLRTIFFHNKPDLQKELDAKRDQIIETRIASLKNKDDELPR
jgi:hypothetical protein